ncbi:MAG TPA: type II toxin-antitoxin system VapC family toxin [Hanamia sp.]
MIIIDSNVLIYSANEEFSYLRKLFQEPGTTVSIISKLEVLGYHKITPRQIIYFYALFKVIDILPITDNLIIQAIKYRQMKSMSVADSIIAATARLYDCDLYTNNVSDFKNIKDFKIINPFDSLARK